MYPDAGPSRPGPSYSGGRPPLRDQISTPRQGSGRFEQDHEGERGGYGGRPQDTPNGTFPHNSSPWSRPQPRPGFRPYPNGPPRARTPPPPRTTSEWDNRRDTRPPPRARSRERERPLDDRDRPNSDPSHRPPISNFNIPDRRGGGYVPPPQARDHSRELPPRDRERNRGPRDERYPNEDARLQRSFSPSKQPWSRDRPNPSPPKHRPGSTQPHMNDTPRAYSGPRPPFQNARDRDDRAVPERTPFRSRNSSGELSRSGQGGPGPATSAYQASTRSSPGGTPPWTSRSVRGNSSPAETRHRIEASEPKPALESVPLPRLKVEKVEVEEGELEEGEVTSSPVRPEIDLPRQNDFIPSVQPRDRWRAWPDDRERPREPFDRNRERRWHAGPARSPDRTGSRDLPAAQSQPWKIGQSVDDGWGQKRKIEDGDRTRSVEREVKVEDFKMEEGDTAQEVIEGEVRPEDVPPEEEDRPATPPLPPPPVNTGAENTRPMPASPSGLPLSAPTTPPPDLPPQHSVKSNNPFNAPEDISSQRPADLYRPASLSPIVVTKSINGDLLSPSNRTPSRPETPALPSDGIPQQVEAVLETSTTPALPTPTSAPIYMHRKIETLVAAYVPRHVAPYPGANIVVQHASTPSATASQPLSHVSALPPSSSKLPDSSPTANVTHLPSSPVVSVQPVNTMQSEHLPEAAKEEDIVMDSREAIVAPHSPSPIPEPSTAPPTPRPAFSPLLTAGPRSPILRQPTLAERRAVKLPSTQASLSSPFGGRNPMRDPAPTNASQQGSTDSEVWPRTADVDDARSDDTDDEPAVTREMRLVQAMRQAQKVDVGLDVDAIVAWNLSAAPPASARVTDLSPGDRDLQLKGLSWTMGRQQKAVVKLVAKQVARQQERTLERTANLRKEYLMLDEEWREHCGYLDDLMEKRGPPPESLYAIPNAVPAVTPGPIPTTPAPLSEDPISSRAIRRRGAGDAVTTEAEFQEILAAMADTAAKDPNYRASKTTAAVPDMLPLEERKLRFEDDNDLVEDPIAFYDFRGNAEPIWTEEERHIFVRRYLNYPKQFGKIAEAIPDKSASDCVLYYYRTKQEVDYKSMLASRRGVARRKTIPLKKGGKSAALLASLDQKKETVKARTVPTPMRAREDALPTPTAARRGGKPRMDSGARRRVVDIQDDDGAGEEGMSRDASEAPSVTKIKRISTKGTKRPRISSMTAAPNTPGAGPAISTQGVDDGSSVTPQAELLPPIKRSKKAARPRISADTAEPTVDRTVDSPISAAIPISAGGTNRRGVSSYWSVEERKRMKELVAVHQRDFRAISAAMPGKSERQIANYCEGHAADLDLDQEAYGAEVERTPGYNSPYTKEEYFKPATAGESRSRSIYDVYSQHSGPFATHEPRLGVFPSLPRPNPAGIASPAAPTPHRTSPTQPVTVRSGGMRISALLNDEPLALPIPLPETRRDTGDAQSDGTVEDRDEAFRPPSREQPPPVSNFRRQFSEMEPGRGEGDHFRREMQGGRMYQAPSDISWQHQPQQQQPRDLPPQRGTREAPYPRARSPRPTAHHPSMDHSRSSDSVPTRSLAYYPSSDPPPQQHQQHQLPHRTMDYYRSRPDVYRSQTTHSDPYTPSYHPAPPAHQRVPHDPTPAYRPASNQGAPRDQIPRYDHSQPQDWRSYRRTPPPPSAQSQHQLAQSQSHSAPAGRAVPGWYEENRPQGVQLPGIRNVYDGEEGRGR